LFLRIPDSLIISDLQSLYLEKIRSAERPLLLRTGMTQILYIKNMVCPRCIRVVREELEKAGLAVEEVKLGEARVLGATDTARIGEILKANGFELLEDKNIRLVEKIKSLIIDLVHHRGEPINENYSSYLSRETGKDYSVLSHLFSEAENITIEKYIINQKIEKVKELLVYNELSLSEIAYMLGYSSVAYLSSQFKQVTGFTPSGFKKLKSHGRKTIDSV
jgi:AraC family transcriptional regulator